MLADRSSLSIQGLRQVSRQLAVGLVIGVEDSVGREEMKNAVPALLFDQDDGALGPDGTWLSTLPMPGLRARLQ
jgi:hypothetical protein